MAERESGLFIPKVVDHVLLSEISKGPSKYFSNMLAKTMPDKL